MAARRARRGEPRAVALRRPSRLRELSPCGGWGGATLQAEEEVEGRGQAEMGQAPPGLNGAAADRGPRT